MEAGRALSWTGTGEQSEGLSALGPLFSRSHGKIGLEQSEGAKRSYQLGAEHKACYLNQAAVAA